MGRKFVRGEFHFKSMVEEQIKHVNKAIKINKQELERIKVRLADNNRTIRQLIKKEEKSIEIQDLLKFNRFLFQKQREKQAVRLNLERAYASVLDKV